MPLEMEVVAMKSDGHYSASSRSTHTVVPGCSARSRLTSRYATRLAVRKAHRSTPLFIIHQDRARGQQFSLKNYRG